MKKRGDRKPRRDETRVQELVGNHRGKVVKAGCPGKLNDVNKCGRLQLSASTP